MMAPAVQPTLKPNACPMPMSAIPMVATVVQDDPTMRLTTAQMTQADTRNNETKHFVAAIISTDNRKPLTQQEKTRLGQWLQERVKADSLVIY